MQNSGDGGVTEHLDASMKTHAVESPRENGKSPIITFLPIPPDPESEATVETLRANTGSKKLAVANVTPKEAAIANKDEDMDMELLQEQAQAVVEELQKRGACTTLALARMLGLEKSTELNPLLFLLLEKNVLVRVADIPPIWTLSPTYPVNPLLSSSINPHTPAASESSPIQAVSLVGCPPLPPYTAPVQYLQPARVMAQPSQAAPHIPRHPATIITFPPIPAERPVKQPVMTFPPTPPERPVKQPVITFPPIPAESQLATEPAVHPAVVGALQQQQQQLSADYWQSLSQYAAGKRNRNGGPPTPFKKWKKQKNLSELQVRLLKELKERGPTRTLELSKIVGLVTCRDVNPSIYDLKQRNLVVKVNNAPPVWQLKEPGMTRTQFKPSDMEDDEEDDLSDQETLPGASFEDSQISVDSEGHSNFSFFH